MNLTYTVRSLARKLHYTCDPRGDAYELENAGCVVTVRDSFGKVVKQFPRIQSEQAGHAIAQMYIKSQRREH